VILGSADATPKSADGTNYVVLRCDGRWNQCGFFGIPRGLGLATAMTSAAFLPHLEQRIRGASVTLQPIRRASASGSISRHVPADAHEHCHGTWEVGDDGDTDGEATGCAGGLGRAQRGCRPISASCLTRPRRSRKLRSRPREDPDSRACAQEARPQETLAGLAADRAPSRSASAAHTSCR
jgi:hypothetical protein